MLCKVEDDFILEKLRWVITLSNGEVIYQDDDRPGELEPKAWLRLKNYVQENGVSIVRFQIQFCSHIEDAAPPNAEGYYFVQRVEAVAFSGEADATSRYYVVGHLKGNEVSTIYWMVPEIIPVGSDLRDSDPSDSKLIVNKDLRAII